MCYLYSKKADMGIGTLILFIAMILVAAIAAGVLIQTGVSLQNKALLTGDRARSQVSTLLTTMSLYGMDGSNGNLTDFRLKVKLAPGSEALSMSPQGGVLLSFDTDMLAADYTYTNASCQRDPLWDGTGDGYYYNSSTHMGTFSVNYLVEGRSHRPGYIVRGDVVELCFASPGPIPENKKFMVSFIPLRGTPLVIETSTPHIMTEDRIYVFP